MMKRIIYVLFCFITAAVMLMSLTSCKNKKKTQTASSKSATTVVAVTNKNGEKVTDKNGETVTTVVEVSTSKSDETSKDGKSTTAAKSTAKSTSKTTTATTKKAAVTTTAKKTTTKRAKGTALLTSFSAKDLYGNTRTQSIFSTKKLTMVNIWSTDCGICTYEMPDLSELNTEYASKGFQIVGIHWYSDDESVAKAKALWDEDNMSYMSLVMNTALYTGCKTANGGSSSFSFPMMFFVDSEGYQVGQTYVGYKYPDEWKTIIDSLLKEVS